MLHVYPSTTALPLFLSCSTCRRSFDVGRTIQNKISSLYSISFLKQYNGFVFQCFLGGQKIGFELALNL